MKMQYKKPVIYIEQFQASDFIASACKENIHFNLDRHCTFKDGPVVMFTEGNNGYCNQDPRPNAGNDYVGSCYHTAVDPTAYFGS